MILLNIILVFLFIVLVILLVLAVYLLLAPFYFEVNSTTGIIIFRLHHFASGALMLKNETVIFQLRVTWWEKEFDLLEILARPSKVKPKPKKKKKPLPKHLFKRIWTVLKSFQLRQCKISIDTGDMPTNGLLFPMFYWMGRWADKPIGINFNDENIVVLEIENTMGRMLWAYIRA